jgi:hypothetical protein
LGPLTVSAFSVSAAVSAAALLSICVCTQQRGAASGRAIGAVIGSASVLVALLLHLQ